MPKVNGSPTQLIGEWPIDIDGSVFRPVPSAADAVVWQRDDMLTIAADIRPDGELAVSVGRPDRFPTEDELSLVARGVFAEGTEVRLVGTRKVEAQATRPFFVAGLSDVAREKDGS